MRIRFTYLIAAIFIVSTLVGCGGSSSGQSVSIGVYKDAGIVSGLQYTTPTQSGITDSNGAFKYRSGETVTFSVSNVTIGQAAGAALITTFDLVGITPPTSSFGIPTNNPSSKKFQEAVNISLFLQTLDDDSDPTNGIAIPAVVNAVVAVSPLDFKITDMFLNYQSWNNFQDSPPFKVFIGSCRTVGAWGGTKAIKQLGYAANSLYQGLGIRPNVYIRNEASYGEERRIYEYTGSGLNSKEFLYDHLGTLVRQWTRTYNSNGQLTSEDNVYLPNPDVTYSMDNLYDANGNLTLQTVRTGDITYKTVYEYDINGNKTKKTFYANGLMYHSIAYSYNANGTLLSENFYDENNVLRETSTYTYNSNLLISTISYDTGFEAGHTAFEYDVNNNIVKITSDYGSYINVQTITYDSRSNPVARSFATNGLVDSSHVLTWDIDGYLVSVKHYNSTNELLELTEYAYDRNGSCTKLTRTSDGSPTSISYTYIDQVGWGEILSGFTGKTKG